MGSTTSARPRRRTARRVGLVLGAGFVASIALTGVAEAHVEIQPDSVPGGSFSVIAFRVPNESDRARTVTVKVLLPPKQPIASVQTTAIPGWTATTQTRKLAQPVENDDGEQVTQVVSQVTWRATGKGIVPGQYQDFDLSLGALPDRGTMVFNAVQTYSDGTVVTWNEVSADASVEPEHPAPTLTLTAADAAGDSSGSADGADEAAAPGATATDTATAPVAQTTATSSDASDSTWPLVLSAAALVVSLLTALMVWRRGRPAPAPEAADRQLEDSTR